jgi:hypothetical protein
MHTPHQVPECSYSSKFQRGSGRLESIAKAFGLEAIATTKTIQLRGQTIYQQLTGGNHSIISCTATSITYAAATAET